MLLSCLVNYAQSECPRTNHENEFSYAGQISETERTWIAIGTGEWEDPFWKVNSSSNTKKGTYERCVQDPTIFRIHSIEGSWIIIHTQNPDKVWVEPYTDYNRYNEKITVTQLCYENGFYDNRYGSLKNGVVLMPGHYFAYSNSSGSHYCDSSRQCVIRFPENYDKENVIESGVYLGLLAFNDKLSSTKVALLNEETKPKYISFVNEKEMGNATLLYYGVDEAINAISSCGYPSDLKKAVLITFTDGVDQGSLAYHPEHRNSRTYASYLADLIKSTTVQGQPLDAYSIGLNSTDAKENPELFNYNLQCLASEDENRFLVNDVDELDEKLTAIYDNLNNETSQRVITLKVPMMSDGDKYRFTLDGSRADILKSKKWFEGEFDIDNLCLKNVNYEGFSCSSESIINLRLDGIWLILTLYDCRDNDGNLLEVNAEDIDEWFTDSESENWTHNKENEKGGEIKSEVIKSSVAVVFALDCSTSLEELFPLVKRTAVSFIEKLAGNKETEFVNYREVTDFEIDLNDPDTEIYNLMGIRVNKIDTGIYVIKRGNKSRIISVSGK